MTIYNCPEHGISYAKMASSSGCPRCQAALTEPTPEVRTWPAGTARPDDATIEAAARAIYDLMPYDGLHTDTPSKPAWAERGNSLKQDEARRYARALLEIVPTPSPEQSAERAVVEEVRRALDEAIALLTGWPAESFPALSLLFHCRDHILPPALRATKQPQPVRPEEVEPGTRFKWAECSQHRMGSGEVLTLYVYGGARVWSAPGAGWLSDFAPEDRIIPVMETK